MALYDFYVDLYFTYLEINPLGMLLSGDENISHAYRTTSLIYNI